MSVKNRLLLITVLSILFAILSVLSVQQVSKGALFHHLNSLHLNYTIELKEQLNYWNILEVDLVALKKTIINIRQQPIECLENINSLDEFVMRQIGTDIAIQLCKDDIIIANDSLDLLEKYKNSKISSFKLHFQLTQAAKQFLIHSNEFENPISETVNFITFSTSTAIILLALAVILAITAMASSISKTVTIKEQAENDLVIAKEKAENADRAKSSFLSSMSHELRTPLNAILGFGQIIELDLETNKPVSNESLKESIDYIMEAGIHLLKLIDQVLDLEKINIGKIDLHIESIQLDKYCLECISLVENQAKEMKLELTIDLTQNISIQADVTRLKQIMLNLLSNAIKYNKLNGKITLSSKVVENDMVRISITDTGEGISIEKQDKLFQPFNRLGKENGSIQGTGIGLSIVKQLVIAMSGDIGVESSEGNGSTFWFELPIVT